MESVIDSFNNLNIVYNNVQIYTDNTDIPVGYGIEINNIFLTSYQVIYGLNSIYINKNNVETFVAIDEYDIALLKKKGDNNVNISKFLLILHDMIQHVTMRDIDKYKNNKFYIDNKPIEMMDIECSQIKTNIFPLLPVFIFSSTENFEGYGGSVIKDNNGNAYSMLISQNIKTYELTTLPLETMYYILNNYMANNMKFHCFPINMKNNYVNNSFRNIDKNVYITKINDIDVQNDLIFFDKINDFIPYETYILLTGYTSLKIEYIKNRKTYVTNVKLKEFDYDDITINFRDHNKDCDVCHIVFSELSEEKMIELHNKNILMPRNMYDNIYSNDKIIYIKNINDSKIQTKLNQLGIDLEKELYIIKKISGKKMKNIDSFEQIKNNKNITIDMFNSHMGTIKIKIKI